MIEIVKKFLFNKNILIGLMIFVLGVYIYHLRSEVKNLNLQIIQYETTIKNLNATIATKDDSITIAKADTDISNNRLESCYLQLKEMQSAQKEIDDIMSDTTEETSSTTNKDEEVKIQPVIKSTVTQHQEKRGLEFVNKQLRRISEE